MSRTALRRACGSGTLLTEETRLSLSVTVKLAVKEKRPLQRAMLLERLTLWSRGHELKTDSRPGRRLMVHCDSLTTVGLRSWFEEIELVFTARSVPFWEEDRERSLALTGSDSWYIPGTAENTPVSFGVGNVSEELVTCFTLRCGGSHVTLDGLLLAMGERVMGMAENDVLTLTVLRQDGSRESAAPYLTADSDDLLLIPCGGYTPVSLESDRPATAILWARGRDL